MNFDQQTQGYILCCMCGTQIAPNPSNMCLKCIMARVDITEGIPKQVDALYCKGCGRYLNPPNHWLVADLESKELLTYCLKRIRGLNKVRLIDAGFVWTEPHSKRLKVKLKIQKEVFNGTIIQQDFIVEVVIQNHFCDDCHRMEAKDTWNAVAQVRQRVSHKRTFLWIEQMIIKHKVQSSILSIKEENDGLDFFFPNQNACVKFLNFLQSIVPITFKQAKQLIGADLKSNVYNYKFTYSVEIPPICKDDLICLPLKLANHLGSINPLVICHKISNVLYFIDPFTLQVAEIADPARYWTYGFKALATRDRLTEFIILDIDDIPSTHKAGKFKLAEATVARADTMGTSTKTYFTITHLGNILKVGDSAYGYDLENSNFNDTDIVPLKGRQIRSEIILVKKAYPYRRRNRQRKWKLAELTIQEEIEQKKKQNKTRKDKDKEDFMLDIEEDEDMRSQLNLYRVPDEPPMNTDGEDEDYPDVDSDELLDMVDNITLGDDYDDE